VRSSFPVITICLFNCSVTITRHDFSGKRYLYFPAR
jgi:hypothetical protein